MFDLDSMRGHFFGLLDFWTRARDDEGGGYHCYIASDGQVHDYGSKPLLIQARLLYNYSEGIRLGQPAYREQAEHLHRFIRDQLAVGEGWYGSLIRDQLRGEQVLDVYSNSFAALALARYGQATGEAEPVAEGRRLVDLMLERCCPGDLARDGLLGSWSSDPADSEPRKDGNRYRHGALMGQHSGNALLHYTEAVVRLCDAGQADELAGRLRELRSFFLAHIYDPELHVIYDHFKGDWDTPYKRSPSNMGHALEWVDFFRGVPGCELPEAVERGILERSGEALCENGMFQAEFYHPEQRFAGVVDFWVQVEAVKTFNLASILYGEPYGSWARRALDAYGRYCVAEDGGTYEEFDPSGVVLKRTKGGWWKCDYHNVRMCVDLIERPGGILQRQAVA